MITKTEHHLIYAWNELTSLPYTAKDNSFTQHSIWHVVATFIAWGLLLNCQQQLDALFSVLLWAILYKSLLGAFAEVYLFLRSPDYLSDLAAVVSFSCNL